jgi:hypothetical protein
MINHLLANLGWGRNLRRSKAGPRPGHRKGLVLMPWILMSLALFAFVGMAAYAVYASAEATSNPAGNVGIPATDGAIVPNPFGFIPECTALTDAAVAQDEEQ